MIKHAPIIILMIFLLSLVNGLNSDEAWGGDGENVPSFALEIRLTGESGPVVDRSLVYGDVVYAQAWVPLIGSASHPVLANLIWQLYDSVGKPVSGVGSVQQLLEMGGEELVTFKVPIKGLVNDKYYLALTHQQAAKPELSFQAVQSFKVSQEVAITRLVVAESLIGKENKTVLYEDQSVYVFVYYTLADTVSSVRIVLDVLDQQTNKLVATRTVVQKKDYMKDEQRLGVHFNPGFFHPDDKLTVRALLTTNGGSAQAQSSFSVQGITLAVHLPSSLRQGERGRYKIEVPASFSAPFIVDFQGSTALRFLGDNLLTGTFLAEGEPGSHEIEVLVVDKNGRRAVAKVNINILPDPARTAVSPEKKVKQKAHSYSVPAQGGAVGSSSPQQY